MAPSDSVCSGRLVPVPSDRYERYHASAPRGTNSPLQRYHRSDILNYAYSAGQPFTMPRIHPWLCDNETLYPPYLNSRQNVNDTVECNSGNYVEQQHPKKTQPFWGSEDDFQKFLEGHPDLRNLVEKLELKPILYDKDNSLISENVDDCPF